MIDISDGLAADVNHLCSASNCGARLSAEAIPISEDARRLSDGRSPLEHALGDGEDFELVAAVAPDDAERLLREQPIRGVQLVSIGECVKDGLWLEREGREEKLEPLGYVHPID